MLFLFPNFFFQVFINCLIFIQSYSQFIESIHINHMFDIIFMLFESLANMLPFISKLILLEDLNNLQQKQYTLSTYLP